MAHSPQWLQQLSAVYSKLPEFIREDVLEGLLVGGGIALPVAMMPNQDPEEKAAAILGGIGAATLGGAASRRIGAAIGRQVHAGDLAPGSFGYNLGRSMGREDLIKDTMGDMLGMAPVPSITGADYGRAIGRAVGDEVFGVAGTLGALAAAQAMDQSKDPQPQPAIGDVAWATIPGAALGLLTSGLAGGMVDLAGLNRALNTGDLDDMEQVGRYTVFGGKKPRVS